ncbi:T3SS effector OspC family protein [Pseudomonas fluorescens]|uniref:Uncharacterized protein n=1 Tax=Pseudomonas fluorescens TaxID=294 RepID=A0A5E7NLC2_PSEFL|nr:T3SS effector OspC family protein [Pseudomonas fluorescens]VVP38035.1 hypothetical protein PS880_04693 [Pseudomonas fluorescens]
MKINTPAQIMQQATLMANLDNPLPNTTARNNISNHLSLIKNTSDPAQKITSEIDESANIIRRFLQKSIAAQSYGEMFSNGFFFKKYGIDLPKQEGKFSFSSLNHLNKISRENLEKITKQVSPLTPSESDLLSKIMSTKIHFRHQSNADLGDSTLNIASNKKYSEHQTTSKSNTYSEDKKYLSNHDFVFLGVEFSGDKSALPLNTIHQTVDFGANAYILDEKYPHGYFTLTDHFDNVIPPAYLHEHSKFIKQFSEVLGEVERIVHGEKGRHDVPIYNTTHMRQALGMHLIDFLRSSEDETFKKFVLNDTLNESNLDKVINFVFQPEFHIPRMVSTTDFQKVSLREITLEDAVKAGNTKELATLIKDKHDACKAMCFAIRDSKREVATYLFDHWTFTASDTKDMSNLGHEVEYMLSNYDANVTILQEFLQRGLVSVNKPFTSVNRGDTMLDNAVKWPNNHEMISILHEYGAVHGKELSKG